MNSVHVESHVHSPKQLEQDLMQLQVRLWDEQLLLIAPAPDRII